MMNRRKSEECCRSGCDPTSQQWWRLYLDNNGICAVSSANRRSRNPLAVSLFILIITLCIGVARPALSQIGIYGDFTAAQISSNVQGKNFLYGPTGGVLAPFGSSHHIELSADIRASYLRGSGQTFTGVVLGPSVSIPVGKFTPSIDALVGFGRYNDGLGNPASTSTDALVEGSVACDRKLTKLFDWRIVQASYSQFFETLNHLHPYSFSTGVVVHLGSR
jgi:hypothetical protein